MRTRTMDHKKIRHFLTNGTWERRLTTTDERVLEGWRWSTLVSYNAAIKKFHRFKSLANVSEFRLPVSGTDICDFVTWAGRGKLDDGGKEKITAVSINRYLCALKAWHTFHEAAYPSLTDARVKLLLKAAGRQDALLPHRPEKTPVKIPDLADLVVALTGRGQEAEAIRDLALVAFWGMARMAELTYSQVRGPIQPHSGITGADVQAYKNATLITLYEAKTARPGEVQRLKLGPMGNALCPVEAINRRLKETFTESDSLFGFGEGAQRTNLTKRRVNEVLAATWRELNRPNLSGHSFRVGGASLRNALGVPVEEIKSLGRWESDCYKLYIKPLSRETIIDSLVVLETPRTDGRNA